MQTEANERFVMDLGTSTPIRSVLVCVAATALAATLVAELLPVLDDMVVARFDQALVWLSAAVGTAVTAWLWLVTVVVAADAGRGVVRDASRGPRGRTPEPAGALRRGPDRGRGRAVDGRRWRTGRSRGADRAAAPRAGRCPAGVPVPGPRRSRT